MRQGNPLSAMAFCLAIHPHVQWADGELRRVGGMLKFACGPLDEVFRVAEELASRLRRHCGVDLQPTKSKAYHADPGVLRAFLDAHPELGYKMGRLDSTPEGAAASGGFGIQVSGLPLGDAAYTHAMLQHKVGKICEGATTTQLALRTQHDQVLCAMLVYCYVPTMNYEARTLPPSVLRVHLRRLDNTLVAVAAAATGVEYAQLGGLVLRRLRLPKRHHGGALRSLENTAPAAYVGGVCDALACFPHRVNQQGRWVPGFMPVVGGGCS